MRARDIMYRAVATTTPETTVEEVARLMINLRISGIPVLDKNGQLVGIITEGDLLRRAESPARKAGVLHVRERFGARDRLSAGGDWIRTNGPAKAAIAALAA